MKHILLSSLVLFFTTLLLQVQAQNTLGLVGYYSFDNCDAVDESGAGSNGIIFGDPGCECGVKGSALKFDGVDDYIEFQGAVNNYFTSVDLTVSFYVKSLNAISQQSLMSKRENCNDTGAFVTKMIPIQNLLTAQLSESSSEINLLSSQLAPTCWQHITVTRDGDGVTLYLNGEEQLFVSTIERKNMFSNAPLSFANDPCLGQNGLSRFAGLLDEVYVYNRKLTGTEVNELYLGPDQLVNNDTTIFLGDFVPAFTNTSCATSYSWSPSATVDTPNEKDAILTPTETTTYYVSYTDDYGCVSQDSLIVNVVDASLLPCDTLFIAKGFTPNGDGLNDAFLISNPHVIQEMESFSVFDRWGNRVFATNDPFDKWDGRVSGTKATPGIYVYQVRFTCDGEKLVKSGSVTLLE